MSILCYFLDYFTTTANNEWTAITESTSTTLSGITTTSVGQIPFSSKKFVS